MACSRFAGLDPAGWTVPAPFVERLATPALVVHLDHVRENVARVLAATGGRPERWRPHLKTTKLPEVWDELLAARVRHFKCATVREARLLLERLERRGIGDADLLVAYPLTGPALRELGRLAGSSPVARLSLLVDDPGGVDELASLPPAVGAFVDVNPGADRTGVPIADWRRVVDLAGVSGARFRGIHAYAGHLHGHAGGRERALACYDRVVGLLERLAGAGRPAPEVVTSGTPTFVHALAHPGLAALEPTTRHRVSPGTVVLHDLRTEQEVAEPDLLPAATVLTRIVSRPAPEIVTCDAGSKSLGADAGDPVAFVMGRADLEPAAPSEEHLPLRVRGGVAPRRGDVLQLIPRHVCTTVNLAERAVLVDAGRVVAVAEVRGRAHDLLLD